MNELPLVSIVTVAYNAATVIEETILSIVNQTYSNIEYIIIDGGSTDGTIEIIEKYADRISYWVSESDKGIYDAMNKGILKAAGEWVNFMNCGDVFVDNHVLKCAFENRNYMDVDVIYGNSLMKKENGDIISCIASNEISRLKHYPIYRHGASFVRTSVHKLHLFDLSQKKLGYALDYNCIHSLYVNDCRFVKIDLDIMIFDLDGVSNQPLKSAYYNFMIATDKGVTLSDLILLFKNIIGYVLRLKWIRKFVRVFYAFFAYYMANNVISHIPIWMLRKIYYKFLGMKIGKHSVVNMSLYVFAPKKLEIGEYTHVNRGCFIDARGGCKIGKNVSISHQVSIVTGGHDCDQRTFPGRYLPIEIGDNVWLGVNATILQNVKIGDGAVVAAGAVVTKDVLPFDIVGGVPAKVIGKRIGDLDYHCYWELPFV